MGACQVIEVNSQKPLLGSGFCASGGDDMPVKISDLIDEMDLQFDETFHYLNKETGAFVMVSAEILSIAEESDEDDDFSGYPDWQKEEILGAIDIIDNWDKYVELPSKYEINEYNIMEEFCLSLNDEQIGDRLLSAIRGKGAFRRFKDSIIRLGLGEKWYGFHWEALQEIAVEWCEDNDIPYIL
jgi:hypothetical protein